RKLVYRSGSADPGRAAGSDRLGLRLFDPDQPAQESNRGATKEGERGGTGRPLSHGSESVEGRGTGRAWAAEQGLPARSQDARAAAGEEAGWRRGSASPTLL